MLRPGSKLSATRQFALTTLAEELAVEGASEAELLAAMDWLLARQERVEAALARRELEPGGVVLYDLSSSYLEGSASTPAACSQNTTPPEPGNPAPPAGFRFLSSKTSV